MKTINDFEIIEGIPPIFPADAWVALDLEIFKADKKKLHRPTGEFASLALTRDGQRVYVITDEKDLSLVSRCIEDCGIILQNGKFDIGQLRRWIPFPKRVMYHDTLYVDRILYSGYYERFDLAALTRRHLQAYLDKEARDLFSVDDHMTSEKIEYNARDAVVTWRIAMKQMEIMKKADKRIWYDVDQPAVWAFLDFKGVLMNAERWMQIAEENKAAADALKATFPFNPNSPAQVKKHFVEKGFNIPNTNAETLSKVKDPMIPDLQRYKKVAKKASTYGKTWLTRALEADGRVYTNYDVNRAESGRTASSDPNLQNIPVRDTPVYRECFIAAPGHVMIGGDFGQQEIRTAAYLSGDDELLKIFESGKDIYASIASLIHKREIKKSDPERRAAKGVVLGAIYGLTAYGLMTKLNNEKSEEEPEVSEEDCEKLLETFFSMFPKLHLWMEKQFTKVGAFVKTPYGRRFWINEHTYQAERNALNAPNQGGGADMLKIALALLHCEWDYALEPFPVVMQTHDEIILEVREENKDYGVAKLEECMVKAGNITIPGIPIVVEIKTGKNWYEVH